MEIYYFITGVLVTAIAILIYQYRFMIRNIEDSVEDVKSIREGYEVLKNNQSSILQKMSEDNFVDAVEMNSNISGLKTQIDSVKSDLNSLIKQHENLRKKTANDKLELVQNYRAGIEQMTNNRQY
jgi:hypothetical protein|tara:strand:+ start:2367 stop:2741 length:375 start_codon:yes stop_codon:yes gene_type:complete